MIINLNTPSDDVVRFTFPDGQRHIKFKPPEEPAIIVSRIASADDLFDVLLAADVLVGYDVKTSLFITYLLGARMDRPLSYQEPYTLRVVASLLDTMPFEDIYVFDPHSMVALDLLRGVGIDNSLFVARVLDRMDGAQPALVAPDAGAREKVLRLASMFGMRAVLANKRRDLQTGRIRSLEVEHMENPPEHCLIVDDICDGGATFIDLAEKLRQSGVKRIDLAVSHGIFSKGTELPGIDYIYTTDSYVDRDDTRKLTVFKEPYLDICDDWR